MEDGPIDVPHPLETMPYVLHQTDTEVADTFEIAKVPHR